MLCCLQCFSCVVVSLRSRQLSFYGAYHAHPLNQLVHVIFVPVGAASAVLRRHKYSQSAALRCCVVDLGHCGHLVGACAAVALVSGLSDAGRPVRSLSHASPQPYWANISLPCYLGYAIYYTVLDAQVGGAGKSCCRSRSAQLTRATTSCCSLWIHWVLLQSFGSK